MKQIQSIESVAFKALHVRLHVEVMLILQRNHMFAGCGACHRVCLKYWSVSQFEDGHTYTCAHAHTHTHTHAAQVWSSTLKEPVHIVGQPAKLSGPHPNYFSHSPILCCAQVWSGTHKEPEHNLLDSPVALTSFNAEAHAKLPSLAVAAGAHVYIYRNLRPYYKFVLPPEDVNEAEQACW
eukprot:1148886-Pelagomonas_calceolata.AAC.2